MCLKVTWCACQGHLCPLFLLFSTRLRSLEQDVHWLKEQLTGSQLSLAGASMQSGLNLDRYDPDDSAASALPPATSRFGPSRHRSSSLPGPEAPRADRRARRERSDSAPRRRGRQRRRQEEREEAVTSDDLLSSSGSSYGGRRRSQSPLLAPLRAEGPDGARRRSRRGSRRRRGVDSAEEDDPYQRYMSEPFALRRERHGAFTVRSGPS